MNKIIEFQEVRKEFLNGSIIANNDISFFIKEGEVHALAGENGAGKSTLLSILFGLYKPTNGKIFVRGVKIKYNSAIDAIKDGMGMVHQHFQLVDKFTVAENIVLGSEEYRLSPKEVISFKKEIKLLKNNVKTKFGKKNYDKINEIKKILKANETSHYGFLNRNKISNEIDKLVNLYDFNIKAKDKISSLTVGQEQKVEILKLLYKKSDILIFDEPTAMLNPDEIDQLIKIILQFKKQGKTVILITHKLDEIKRVADRVTVLRKGKYIGTEDVKTITYEKLSKMMVGYNIITPKINKNKLGNTVLQIKDLNVQINRINKLKKINFSINKGEIVAIAGIEGNGQVELVHAISGLNKKYEGTILFNNFSIKKLSINKRNKLLAHIPENRHKYGMILDLKSYENVVFKHLKDYSNFGFLNRFKMMQEANQVLNNFDVRGTNFGRALARGLSGGNQQKLVVGREISSNKDLLISFQATRGLDVGAINYIHNQIIKERAKGKAILLISYDLNEVLQLSDKVIILNAGEITGILTGNNINSKNIGILMSRKVDK